MANSIDFRADQVQTSKIIVTGSTPQKTLLIYGIAADGSPSNQGNINQAVFPSNLLVQSDAFLFVSGAVNARGSSVPSIAVFGGDVGVLGAFYQGPVAPLKGGDFSHSQGFLTLAIGNYSHAEGAITFAVGNYSHAEGVGTIATGEGSHAEGLSTVAFAANSHAEGGYTLANNLSVHTEGYFTTGSGFGSHAEGYYTITTTDAFFSHVEGHLTTGSGVACHAEGYKTFASGSYSHAEGQETIASGSYSHAEGFGNVAFGAGSHAEGSLTFAYGNISHTEGQFTTASTLGCHAEGYATLAEANFAHTEGHSTTGSGLASHAEGKSTIASGSYSHAEGISTIAFGTGSHAGGWGTIASGSVNGSPLGISSVVQTVFGRFNERGNTTSNFVIGNGTGDADTDRRDIFRAEETKELVLSGGIRHHAIYTSSEKVVLTKENYIVIVDTTAANSEVTLPEITDPIKDIGLTLIIRREDVDSSINSLSIEPNGSNTGYVINGFNTTYLSYPMTIPRQSLMLTFMGVIASVGRWFIIQNSSN